MKILLDTLSVDDLPSVDALMKKNSATLGFLPYAALQDYQQRGGLIGAKTSDGQLIGYLLYFAHPTYFRIAHLCVSENYRGKKIARNLLHTLRVRATTQRIIKLWCRRDYPANEMWPTLDFIPVNEKPGRSLSGHPLTLWYLTLAPGPQLDLFQALTLNDNLDVVIDAQVFFDFAEPSSDKALPSQSLLSDFLADSLNLWITDELFVEINRHRESNQRDASRQQAHAFPKIAYDPAVVDHYETLLRGHLPANTKSQQSDIRHLAKTTASNSDTFVTRDNRLLKRAELIYDLTGVRVVSPTSLIVSLYEISNDRQSSYERISGTDLTWRPLALQDLASFPVASFLEPTQRHGPFTERLNAFLARPDQYECTLLQWKNNVVAFRIRAVDQTDGITFPLIGIARGPAQAPIGRFVMYGAIVRAIATGTHFVKVESVMGHQRLVPDLLDMGFLKHDNSFVRFALPYTLEREQTLRRISLKAPYLRQRMAAMSSIELERWCSPLSLTGARQCFMIPIRPGYAMSLFDARLAGEDLFGGKTNVLIQWNNVYYRKATHSKMIQAPGRVFWYVSRPQSSIVAVSHLDEVRIDSPKELFRTFEELGALDWKAIFDMCGGDVTMNIMAIRFSNSFLFQSPVSLSKVKALYAESGDALVVQAPSKVPQAVSRKLFELGYGVQS